MWLGALLFFLGLASGIVLAWIWQVRARGGTDAAAAVANATQQGLAPTTQVLAQVQTELRQLERARIDAYAGLREQLGALQRSSVALGQQTVSLASALRAPTVRGRWGEMQLKRIVELAGMVEHCDFDTQVAVGDGARPDLVVHLAGDRHIPIDAKVPCEAWLQLTELDSRGDHGQLPWNPNQQPGASDQTRRTLLAAHAKALRAHVDQLAGKAYWQHFQPTPEFVVLFLPGEALLDAALSVDPALTDYAFSKQVVIATPATLIALLRTVAFGWRAERLGHNAEEVYMLGKQLHDRIGTLAGHLSRVGGNLNKAVESYNAAVRSFESRVLVSTRRMTELGVTTTHLTAPEPIDRAAVGCATGQDGA